MKSLSVFLSVFLLATVLLPNALVADNHIFHGQWISDAEMAVQAPRPVRARQLQRNKLPPVRKDLQNRHILFRKTFELDAAKDVRVFVTADDYYKLYVNGVFAGQGPAAGIPEYTYYNEIDISRLVHPGRNVLAVHTFYQGLVNRVWVSGDNRHGLLLDVTANGRVVACSDTSFRTARHRAYSALSESGYGTQFMERYDAAAPEVGFERTDFDDTTWAPATVHPQGKDYAVFPQPTAMLEFEDIHPVACTRDAEGALNLDFGGVYVGSIVFAAKGPKNAEIGIFCGQELDDKGRVRDQMRCGCTYRESIALSGGPHDVLNQYDYKSFRYCRLKVPQGVEVEVDSIVLRARHMPFTLRAKPNFGNDPRRAKIWKLAVDSFHYGVQEQIQDCMDREKGYYLGDGVYTMYAHCLLTKDWAPARRFFDDFLRTRVIDRGLVTCANCSFMQEIAEYPLMLILFAQIYIQETGDAAFIEERYDALADLVDSYRERYARADGLLTNLDKWCVVEWPKKYQDGYDADVREGRVCHDVHNVINAWYLGAVKCLDALAVRFGKPRRTELAALEASFTRTFWDAERNLFIDREGSRHVSLPGNVYAAFFRLEPETGRDAFARNFRDLVRARQFTSINLFQFVPLFATLRRGNSEARALCDEMLVSEDAWLRMLREGATRTFEGWGKDSKWNTSLYHLTFASIAIFLTGNKLESL